MSDPSRVAETPARKTLSALHELYPDADVDTHVKRVAYRLGLTLETAPAAPPTRVGSLDDGLWREIPG